VLEDLRGQWHSSVIQRPENRFAGGNRARGGNPRVDALIEEIGSLSTEELAELRNRMPIEVERRKQKLHSVLELRGLGKEFWRSIDVDAYLKEERDSWES